MGTQCCLIQAGRLMEGTKWKTVRRWRFLNDKGFGFETPGVGFQWLCLKRLCSRSCSFTSQTRIRFFRAGAMGPDVLYSAVNWHILVTLYFLEFGASDVGNLLDLMGRACYRC